MPKSEDPEPTLQWWIADTLRDLRDRAGLKPETIHPAAGISGSQVWRFENHETWPRDFETLLVAYSDALGADDPRDLLAVALERWRDAQPSMPLREEPTPEVRFAEVLKAQRKADRAQAPASPAEKPNATPKRKAGGR
jgi:hypothetical protein